MSWPEKEKMRKANTLSWPVKKVKNEIGQHVELASKKRRKKKKSERPTH